MIKCCKKLFWCWTSLLLLNLFLFSSKSVATSTLQTTNTRSLQNCSNEANHRIQGFEEVDVSSFIRGCIGTRTLNPNRKFYEETHIVYVEHNFDNKVFLTIHDDFEKSLQSFSGSTVKPKYSIVLVSPTPIDWIISFENNITDYQFYVTSDSTVRSGSSSLPSESLQFSVSISFGRHFHGCQIKNKFCKTYKCHLTTFLQLQSVDSLQLTVGVFNESGIARKCHVGDVLNVIGQTSRVAAYSYNVLPTSGQCANKFLQSSKSCYLFVVELVNCTRNATVELELKGVSSVPSSKKIFIVLYSPMPIRWISLHDSKKDVTTTVNFAVPQRSSVNVDELAFSGDRSGVHIQHVPRMVPKGKTLLDVVHLICNASVTSYAKFSNSPSRVRITFDDEHRSAIYGPSNKLDKNLQLLLHYGLYVNARGSFFNISRVLLQKFGLNISDIEVGDGSCSFRQDPIYFIFSNLSKCGLKRISIDVFKIEVFVKGIATPVWFSFPNSDPPRIRRFSDSTFSRVISSPIQYKKEGIFHADVTSVADKKFGVKSLIEECYLTNQKTQIKHVLKLRCPVGENFATSSSNIDTPMKIMFNVTEQMVKNYSYNLTCVLTRCLIPVQNSNPSLLDQCPPKNCRSNSMSSKSSVFTETVSIEAFIFSKPAGITEQGSSFGLVIGLTAALSLVIIVTAMTLVVVCRYRIIKKSRRKKHTYTSSKRDAFSSKLRISSRQSNIYISPDENECQCMTLVEKENSSVTATSIHALHANVPRRDSTFPPTCGSTSTEEISLLTSSSASSDGDSAGKNEV